MELLEQMCRRRSVRSYCGEEISEEKLKMILQAGLLAPTSRGRQSREFIVVRDKRMLEKLSICREHGSSFLKKADKAIVVVGDSSMTDVWVEDCSIAMAMMYLMADSLGIGACWIQGRNRFTSNHKTTDSYVKELLHIPEHFSLEAIMSLGMPENHPDFYELEKLPYHKIHNEIFK